MTPKELVDAAVVAYVQGGLSALQEVTGPDPVESPVFWEAIARIGANRRALATGRYRHGVDRWEQIAASREEQHDEQRRERRGGNL